MRYVARFVVWLVDWMAACLVLFWVSTSVAELYRCADDKGRFHYSDRPCGVNSQYKTGDTLQSWSVQSPSSAERKLLQQHDSKRNNRAGQSKAQSLPKGCKRFSATELRNFRVKDKIVKGMPKAEIRKRFGRPDTKESKSGEREKWYFDRDRVHRMFSFQNGCVVGWKERWKQPKSKISKYNE